MAAGRKSLRIAGMVLAMVLGGAQLVAAEETVRIGLDPGPYPPFTDKKPDGSRFGFEPDLLAALCEGMKVKCELNEITWDGLIPALNGNKVDMIYKSLLDPRAAIRCS
jgi:polar amino acid transport system substrate-binding protein